MKPRMVALTAVIVVWKQEMDIAADAGKHLLKVYKYSCCMGGVAGNPYNIIGRLIKLEVVGIAFQQSGKQCKPDIYQVLVLDSSLLFHVDILDSKPGSTKEERNYKELFVYQFESLFLAISILQATKIHSQMGTLNRLFSGWYNWSTAIQ